MKKNNKPQVTLRDFLNLYECRIYESEERGSEYDKQNVQTIRIYTHTSWCSHHYFEFANSDWNEEVELDKILNEEILNTEIDYFELKHFDSIYDCIEIHLKGKEED